MTMSAVEKAALLPPTLTIWRHCASDFRYRRVTFWPGQEEITSGYQVLELPPPSWCLPKFGKQQQCRTPPPCLRPPNSVQPKKCNTKKTIAMAQYRHHPAAKSTVSLWEQHEDADPIVVRHVGLREWRAFMSFFFTSQEYHFCGGWCSYSACREGANTTGLRPNQPVPQKQCHDVV